MNNLVSVESAVNYLLEKESHCVCVYVNTVGYMEINKQSFVFEATRNPDQYKEMEFDIEYKAVWMSPKG